MQTCIVHLSRYCLSFCGWKERQALARELKTIYRAETAEAAAKRLEEFEAGPWGQKVSDDRPELAAQLGTDHSLFAALPRRCEKIIYTTNAIESLHMQLRKVLKNPGALPHMR